MVLWGASVGFSPSPQGLGRGREYQGGERVGGSRGGAAVGVQGGEGTWQWGSEVAAGSKVDACLLAVLLSSTSVTRSCHLAVPSPHSEDPQVRNGGSFYHEGLTPQRLPQLTYVFSMTPPVALHWVSPSP